MHARRFIAALATASMLSCVGLGLGAVVPGMALSAPPAGATTSDEANLLALTNQARASVGAPALSPDADISSVADFEAPAGNSRDTTVADPQPSPTVAPRPTTTTAPPPPEPTRPVSGGRDPGPAPAPVAAALTFNFVLGALRALDSGHGHH